MKLGQMKNAGRRNSTLAFMTEEGSGSLELFDVTPREPDQQTRMEAVKAGAVSQRVRLNST